MFLLSKPQVERIHAEPAFIECVFEQATQFFFKYALLPELLGKYYSKPITTQDYDEPQPADESETDHSGQIWCYCKQGEYGEMIMCESGECEIEWFHTDCLRITTIPKDKWRCPDCKKKNCS